jgi:hypothetical protein
MAKKKPDLFEGYGSDSSVVVDQKPITIEDLQDSLNKMTERGYLPAPPIFMAKNTFDDFKRVFGGDYGKEYYANCAKFEALFHKGVILEHQGSKVRWEIVSTFKHSSTKEVRCRIKSLSSNITKELASTQFNDFKLVGGPKAVTVLFGPKDE